MFFLYKSRIIFIFFHVFLTKSCKLPYGNQISLGAGNWVSGTVPSSTSELNWSFWLLNPLGFGKWYHQQFLHFFCPQVHTTPLARTAKGARDKFAPFPFQAKFPTVVGRKGLGSSRKGCSCQTGATILPFWKFLALIRRGKNDLHFRISTGVFVSLL